VPCDGGARAGVSPGMSSSGPVSTAAARLPGVSTARRWRWVGGLALVLIAGAVWLWRVASAPGSEAATPVVPPRAERAPSAPVGRTARAALPGPPPSLATAVAPGFDPAVADGADPCWPAHVASLPSDYKAVTIGGVTVAWDPAGHDRRGNSSRVHPLEIAAIAAGMLEEAAQLIGTAPRPDLAIIVDASEDEFRARTGALPWMGGFYDGGAIRTFTDASAPLGVGIETLRHEVMHAQLHTAVGCVPTWFNEGLAQYFEGAPALRRWFALLRERRIAEPGELRDAGLGRTASVDEIRRAYATSFAMVFYLAPHGDLDRVREAVRWLRAAQADGEPHELWSAIAPGVAGREVLTALADRLFGATLGPELDATLAGTVCCADLSSLAGVACRRGPPPPADEKYGEAVGWTDHASTPAAWCSTHW